MSLSHRALLSVAGAICALLLPVMLDRPSYQTVPLADPWSADNFFQWEPAPSDLPASVAPSAILWRNFSPGTGISAGRLESPAFVLDRKDLFVPALGYPNSRYTGLYLESQVDKSRFWINVGAAHEQWESVPLVVPKTFLHVPVRLIAYSDLKEAYIGTGTPYYRSNRPIPGLAFSRLLGSVLFSNCYLLLLFLPAFYLCGRYSEWRGIWSWLPGLVFTALTALALFYACYWSPSLARLLARLWLIGALGLAILALLRHRRSKWPPLHPGLAVAILLTVFQSCFVFSFATVSSSYAPNYLFYPASWTTDNQIPIDVAQIMAKGSPLAEVAFGPWKISDRAPLLSCLLFPAATVLRHFPHQIEPSTQRMLLQMCSFGILNSWVLPVWVLLRRVPVSHRKSVVALLLLAATPFIFFNTVYIWPKLLAATFCLVQHLCLSREIRAGDRLSGQFSSIVLSGLAAGLAFMAHGAAVLAVLAIYIAALVRRSRREWLALLLSSLVMLLVIGPWLAWTKLAAPTTNPLPRFLLTSDFGFAGASSSGVVESALQMYRAMPFSAWLQAKGVAAKTLLGLDLTIARQTLAPFQDPFQGVQSIRAYQFFFLVPSLGLLVIPLLAFLKSRMTRTAAPSAQLGIRELGLAAGLTLLLHFLVMMAPHLLHHYPYFLPLSLHVLAILVITTTDSKVFRALAFANYLLFLLFWIVLILARTPLLSIGGIACALGLLSLATVLVGRWAVPGEPEGVHR